MRGFFTNHLTYFRENNKYKDWPKDDEKRVLIGAVIEEDGTPTDVQVKGSSEVDELDQEAIRLIKNITFEPGKNKDGKPLRVPNFVIFVFFPPK